MRVQGVLSERRDVVVEVDPYEALKCATWLALGCSVPVDGRYPYIQLEADVIPWVYCAWPKNKAPQAIRRATEADEAIVKAYEIIQNHLPRIRS